MVTCVTNYARSQSCMFWPRVLHEPAAVILQAGSIFCVFLALFAYLQHIKKL